MRTLSGRDLTVGYLQKSGFTNPIYVGEKTELDMKMPNAKVKKIKKFFLLDFFPYFQYKLLSMIIVLNFVTLSFA